MNKKLVLYHTYTGNTELVAKEIAVKTGATLCKLEPVTPFSSDYNAVVDEWQNNSVKAEVPIKPLSVDLSEYSEIVLCSPVWWYTVTPVVFAFLKKHDLSGKTVYPVFTSAGWFGHSYTDVKKLFKGDLKEKTCVKFSENYTEHKIVGGETELSSLINKLK